MMVRTSAVVVGMAMWLGGAALDATAQDAVLTQLYGQGVHAYFSGDPAKAHERLTAVIDAGSQDPRVYYFRAMAYIQLGREAQAQGDFERGAQLETADVNQFYPVSRSLERVQGSARAVLERYRTQARLAAFEQAEQQRLKRFGSGGAAGTPPVGSPESIPAPVGDDLLNAPRGGAPAKQPGADPFGAVPNEPAPAKGAEADPFGAAPADNAPAQKAAPSKAGGAADDPFAPGGEAPPAAPPKEAAPADDPFGGGAAPAIPAPKAPAADPFGGDAPAAAPPAKEPAKEAPGGNPFGGDDAPAAPAPAPAPAAGDKAAGDPFGDDPAPAAEKKPADEPAADEAPEKAEEKAEEKQEEPKAEKKEEKPADDADPFSDAGRNVEDPFA